MVCLVYLVHLVCLLARNRPHQPDRSCQSGDEEEVCNGYAINREGERGWCISLNKATGLWMRTWWPERRYTLKPESWRCQKTDAGRRREVEGDWLRRLRWCLSPSVEQAGQASLMAEPIP